MNKQLIASLILSTLSFGAFALPGDEQPPLTELQQISSPSTVTEGGADRLIKIRHVAEGGSDRLIEGRSVAERLLESRTVAEGGAERLLEHRLVAENGAERVTRRSA
jgi:hypothetical protein